MKLSNRLKTITISAVVLAVVVAVASFTTPVADNPPVTGEIQVPAEVKQMLQRACYDCHSNTSNLKWFDRLPVVAGLVKEDILTARKHLNFSEWDKLSKTEQESALWEAYNMINSGNMPLPSYAALHSNAKVTPAELSGLRNYLNTRRAKVVPDTLKTAAAAQQWDKPAVSTPQLPVSANGIRYMPEFRQWQVMSTTSRFDNTTMRVMFANPVAMQAIKENNIHPWPDGAVIAKVVWDKNIDNEGNIHPGKFLNIQYMVRNKALYKETDGWGYAKFETPNLKPYGTLMTFKSCASCHRAANKTGGIFDLSTLN
ncbi:heme-binding domain-containing protein [Chitinophaga sp. RAB17]|uniref:heme-binding domain-containing protein n=1 Tax=Chitinophaga sp. RAB17 TaxID=3233049 RepID=UPI003F931A56